MIKQFELKNFGPLEKVTMRDLSKINLIIGANSTGKTFLLKALYSVIRAQEESGRGQDRRAMSEILSEKLFWTFQARLGDIVSKGKNKRLKASVTMADNCSIAFEFGQDTSKKITTLHDNLPSREANSIFLPPKEVLSLGKVILKSRLQDKEFGYDDTCFDLVVALQKQRQWGKNYKAFKESREQLESMFAGRIEFDDKAQDWVYRKGNSKFSIHTTAEGVKKIGILDTLLSNRTLSPKSVIFIDEPESALHPTAITKLMDIISLLAEYGIQFFIASHSYFVVKKLFLIAQSTGWSIPVLYSQDEDWLQDDLKDGMPENSIINESINLYQEEIGLALD